jgi:hypothetical protein
MSKIYKQALIHRYVYHTYGEQGVHYGPLWNALQTCKEYDLHNHIVHAIEDMPNMTITVWKRLVRSTIREREQKKWVIMSGIFKSLHDIKAGMTKMELWSWWAFVQDNPHLMNSVKTLVKMLLNVHGLRSCTAKYDNSSPQCTECDSHTSQTVAHVLFDCDWLSEWRKKLWSGVVSRCPPGIVPQLLAMTSEEKTVFLLSGLHNAYVKEWSMLFEAILEFVTYLYWKAKSIQNIE